MKIGFFWFGLDGRYGHWNDGLKAALEVIEKEHYIGYYDVNEVNIEACKKWKPDAVLFWEAPCTQYSKDADKWRMVTSLPFPKFLCFAGGPLKAIDVKDFELVFVESKINEEDCERQGIPFRRAFGVNTQVMKPKEKLKIYDAFLPATFADWKRHTLFAEAMGPKGLCAGRLQEFDRNGYNECQKRKVHIMPEQTPEKVADLINQSMCVLNTSNEQGGGQRATLEAMACGVPVIVMSDSPKNREYVEESGGGTIADPSVDSIHLALARIKAFDREYGAKAYNYIMNGYTEKHYALSLLSGFQAVL